MAEVTIAQRTAPNEGGVYDLSAGPLSITLFPTDYAYFGDLRIDVIAVNDSGVRLQISERM